MTFLSVYYVNFSLASKPYDLRHPRPLAAALHQIRPQEVPLAPSVLRVGHCWLSSP